MTFVLSKLLWLVASPGNFLTILLVIGVVALLVRWRRTGTALVTLGTLGLLTITVTPVAYWSLAPLENRFPEPRLPDHVDGIILLGGAVDPELSYLRRHPQVNSAAARVTETAALARRYPDARIIVTGGSAATFGSRLNEADPTRELLLSLGVPDSHIILEKQSRNTIENAQYSYNLVHPKPGEIWLLVTSGFHMPRSVGCFRRVGWKVVPYVVNYRTAHDAARRLELSGRLDDLTLATREWMGLIAYYLMGRIDSVFPGP